MMSRGVYDGTEHLRIRLADSTGFSRLLNFTCADRPTISTSEQSHAFTGIYGHAGIGKKLSGRGLKSITPPPPSSYSHLSSAPFHRTDWLSRLYVTFIPTIPVPTITTFRLSTFHINSFPGYLLPLPCVHDRMYVFQTCSTRL